MTNEAPHESRFTGTADYHLLALGLAFTTATRMRFGGLPVGFGELLLAVWIARVVMATASVGLRDLPAWSRSFMGFWAFSALLLALGATIASFTDLGGYKPTHDAVAYLFAAAFTIALVVAPLDYARALRTTFAYVILFLVSILVAAMVGLPGLAAEVWYGMRFRALANDPNQLAFYMVSAPFLCAWFSTTSRSTSRKIAWFGGGILAAVLGILTASDALTFGWLVGCISGYAAYYLARVRTTSFTYWVGVLNLFILPLLVAIAGVWAGAAILDDALQTAVRIAGEGGQGATRIALWENAAKVIAESPVAGFGPGAHAGVFTPHSGAEAHNSLLQWGTNAGALGVALLGLLLVQSGRRIVAGGSGLLTGAYASLMGVLVFHHALRQPVFWLVLVCLVGVASTLSETRSAVAVQDDIPAEESCADAVSGVGVASSA